VVRHPQHHVGCVHQSSGPLCQLCVVLLERVCDSNALKYRQTLTCLVCSDVLVGFAARHLVPFQGVVPLAVVTFRVI